MNGIKNYLWSEQFFKQSQQIKSLKSEKVLNYEYTH